MIALPLTGQEPRVGFPLTFELSARGLPKKSWIKIAQIRTLSVTRIGRKLGSAAADELQRAVDGLNEIVG